MQKRWKKVAAILGVSAMVITQSFPALAEENEVTSTSLVEGQDDTEEVDAENKETPIGDNDTNGADSEINAQTDEVAGDEAGVPTELGWDEGKSTTIKFKHNMSEVIKNQQYYVWLYRDGNLVTQGIYNPTSDDTYTTLYVGAFKTYRIDTHSTWLIAHDAMVWESGTYTYRVKVPDGTTADDDLNSGIVSDMSSGYEYTKPTTTLATPANVHWDDTQIGLLKWDEVENADYYQVSVYELKDGEENYRTIAGGYIYDGNSCDYSECFTDNAEYVAVVSARTYNKALLQSDFSEEATYKYEVTDDNTASGDDSVDEVTNDKTGVPT
jgi:hypothetical protein